MKNITYRFCDNRYVGRKQINNKRITVYGNTQKECYQNLKDAIKNLKDNKPIKTTNTKNSIKFVEYFDKWYKQNKEPFVVYETQKDILRTRKLSESIHLLPINKITKDILFNLLKTLPSNRTKEKCILYLKAIFKSAVMDNVIKDNPFNNLITLPRKIKTKPAFTYEEQVKILEGLKNSPIRPIILIYLITGMRKNEFNFKSIEKDINLKTQILTARNLKGRNFEIRHKKIKLSQKAISLIMNNLDIIHKYNAENVYREFAKFLEEINIKGSIVTCRHTFATNCFYLGKPQLLISREMGHHSTNITENVYTDIDYNLNKEKIIKLYNNLYNLE